MIKSWFSLFLKSNCPLCDRSADEYICHYCQQQLNNCRFQNPCQFWSGDLPLFVWGIYSGKLKMAIAALKYNNSPQLGELMGYWLGEAWLNAPGRDRPKKLIVIPIPLHQKRLQQRGFNQAELIAKSFCRLTGHSLQVKGLERIRDTQPMFGLNSLVERENNLSKAFILGKDLQKRRPKEPVLLIDDIYTTGTTVREAANLLRSQKIPVLGVGAIAIAEGRRENSGYP
ncbi:phosphoribosyltransferase [Hydrococcus rivularis NIES-593]|uniref:Phosphoribosyltransferase n=1 Tax=Hydrococcus rivularis NIES-593 TaxID=1921803 RepID=A0A1U7HI06_9CYAN|nr:ComF family protein [Hydrococcus rivularis]OKH23226.1 phosphoribosyltransferase [Hydrococcus rivularis NIES-593]